MSELSTLRTHIAAAEVFGAALLGYVAFNGPSYAQAIVERPTDEQVHMLETFAAVDQDNDDLNRAADLAHEEALIAQGRHDSLERIFVFGGGIAAVACLGDIARVSYRRQHPKPDRLPLNASVSQ